MRQKGVRASRRQGKEITMAKFSSDEKQLLRRVADDRLQTSLAMIREAAENIWVDTPHIIQDYTDHGISHCERLACSAVRVLAANNGKELSAEEAYLLLASIYLHDIGMQCDVIRFPEIKKRAETLGAYFDIEFTARSASQYSSEEQAAIRKNHQYLSIAWIDQASRSGETVLGPAAKSIPDVLVDDLMDICKHHTKLPITDCPIAFKFDPNGRKQLVAALLRFSDELDIDEHRVNIEAVRNFLIDPRNGLYWWLHHQTKINFRTPNRIDLTVRLHPDDMRELGIFVHAAFITEFQSKNRPVLNILVQNNIPLSVSDDSKVVGHDRVPRLPSEIVQALLAMQRKHNPLVDLAQEVRTWLRAIRYEVSDPQQLDDRTIDMLATLDLGTVKQRVLVRCIGGEIAATDVETLDEILDRRTPQGWLISDTRVSDRARELSSKDDAIQVYNLPNFLQQRVWGPYIDTLAALVEKDRIPELYVGPDCYKLEKDQQGKEVKVPCGDLEDYIDGWLRERGKMHISALGDFGAGKTWFCRHYAYKLMQRYFTDPVHNRLPLLITLRAFAKAMTVQQLINDAMLEQYRLPFVGGAFETFQEMNRQGKLLLILDGFDEMARQVDYQTVVDNFWELAKLVDEDSKVILTSRTEYFRWAEETERILGGREFGRQTIVLQPPKFEVVYLQPFSNEQIREVIVRRLGIENGEAIAKRILAIHNLAEMARKPVLIELLLAALDEVSADVLETSARVYLFATNKLLLRNITAEKTFTSMADKLYFLCELAWEMIRSNQLRIHYKSIPELIKSYFGDRIKDQHELDTWDYDLRSQTLLHRNVEGAGYYEFAHKSLAEYFVALKFAIEIGCLEPEFMQTYCKADGKACKMPFEQKDLKGLTETFGVRSLSHPSMRTVLDMLEEMIASNAIDSLWQIIFETKVKTVEQVGYIGGNAATLLLKKKQTFAGADLSRTVLAGAHLCFCQLSTTNLTECNLYQADLSGSKFSEPELKSAKLEATTLTFSCGRKLRRQKQHENDERYASKELNMFYDFIVSLLMQMGIEVHGAEGSYPDSTGKIALSIRIIVNNLDFLLDLKKVLFNEGKVLHFALYDTEMDEFDQIYSPPWSSRRLLV